MMSAVRSMLGCIFLMTALAPGIRAQTRSRIEVVRLKDRFYRLTSTVPYEANFLAYVSDDGILLVDAGQRQTGDTLRQVLASLAGGDPTVKILVNTHAHIDHTGGNLALAGEPLILGPEMLRSTLRSYSYVLYEFPDDALPSITFADSMHVHFGDETIRIIAVPGGHDATDVIVHFVNAGIVCMGDLSYGMTFPSIDAYTGNMLAYPEAIDRALALIPDDVTIVSGHGRETTVAELRQFRDMIVSTTATVHRALAEGSDIATMQRDDLLKDWSRFDGGIGPDRGDWIVSVAAAGPSKFRGSLAGELYHVLLHGDGDAAVARYIELKRDHPMEYPFGHHHLNRVGHWLLGKERIADAITLFQLAVREFPNDASGYDDLGAAFLRAGDKAAAIRNYARSLELDPQNDHARQMLIRLRSDRR
jgi:cyclase